MSADAMQLPVVVRTHLVQPATASGSDAATSASSTVLQLGPMDHLLAAFVTTGVFFVYRFDAAAFQCAPDDFMPLPLVRTAMQQLLALYPQLGGRVHWQEADQTPQIHKLQSGALLFEATNSSTLTEALAAGGDAQDAPLTARSFADGGASLVPTPPISADQARAAPLLQVQHTRFACGSVCLGVRIHHWLCDGEGFFQIVRDLSRLYRALRWQQVGQADSEPPLQPPCNEVYLAGAAERMSAEEREQAQAHRPEHYILLGQQMKNEPKEVVTAPAAASPPEQQQSALEEDAPEPRVLRFSGSELQALKQAASSASTGWASTFEALAAHVHQSVFRARLAFERRAHPGADLSSRSEDLLMSMNCRSAERLDLPPRYVSNGVVVVTIQMAARELETAPLSVVAAAVHRPLHSMSRAQIEQDLRWVAAQPNKTAVSGRVTSFAHTLCLTQWSKLNIYRGLSFERATIAATAPAPFVVSGDPILVAPAFDPSVLYPRLAILMEAAPTARAQQAQGTGPPIDVYLTLPQAVWVHLEGDANFRQYAQS